MLNVTSLVIPHTRSYNCIASHANETRCHIKSILNIIYWVVCVAEGRVSACWKQKHINMIGTKRSRSSFLLFDFFWIVVECWSFTFVLLYFRYVKNYLSIYRYKRAYEAVFIRARNFFAWMIRSFSLFVMQKAKFSKNRILHASIRRWIKKRYFFFSLWDIWGWTIDGQFSIFYRMSVHVGNSTKENNLAFE